MPISKEEKKKRLEDFEQVAPKKREDEFGEFESHLRSFALGGEYILKTTSDVFNALDITGKSRTYEELTGIDLKKEQEAIDERSPLGTTSGTAEFLRYLAPSAAAALPVERGYQAVQGMNFLGRVISESLLGGTEELVTSIIMGETKKKDATSNIDIDIEKAMKQFATGTMIAAPISTVTNIGSASKALDPELELRANYEEGGSMAGGGKPPEYDDGYKVPDQTDEYKYFDKEFMDDLQDRANIEEMRAEGFQEIDITTLREGKSNILDTEIKDIQNKFNRLEETPEDVIIQENKDLFQGVDPIDAVDMLRKNPKLMESLKADIEKDLFDRMDKIDLIKRGDDRIEVGAKSDLYEPRDIDSTKAEQLAMDIKVKRAAKKKLAEATKNQSIASRKLDYAKIVEEVMPEVNKLHKAYMDNPTPETLFDLEEALRKAEPSKQSIFKHHETGRTIGDIGEGFDEVGITMSKEDIRANESTVGIGTRTKGFNKLELQKIEKQRKINKAAHEQFLEDNKEKFEKLVGNEADRIEYEKLVEQDKKYKDTDRALRNEYEKQKQVDTNIEHGDIVEFVDPTTGKSFNGKYVRENEERVVYEINDPHTGRQRTIVVNKKTNKVESAINQGTKGLANKSYEFKGKKTDIEEPIVKDTNNNANEAPTRNEKLVEVENTGSVEKSLVDKAKELFNETKTNFKSSYRIDGNYATYQKIHRQTRDALNVAAKAGADAKEYINDLYKASGEKLGGEFDKGFARNILYTDYASIKGMDKADAMKFVNDNKDIYTKAYKYIEQTAKGIKDKGHMNHVDFTNNGYQIAQRAGLDPIKHGDTIDKLVSIRAMDNEAWDFVSRYGDSNLFGSMINMAGALRKESDDIFKDNPHARVKGYMSETYDSIYRYEMDNGVFKKYIDAEVGMVQGGLPQKLDNSRIGEVIQFPDSIKNGTKEDKLAYAKANNLGVVLDQYANPKAMRKVASEAERLSIGKTVKASDMIPLTYENSVRKITQRDGVIDDIINTPDNDLFSSKPREGMVKLTEDELKTIPRELVGKVAYVNKDFKHMLLGNKQIQVAEKQWSKITEQLLKDSVSHFKENVVLKNPASWANNMGYNFFVNLQEGMSPIKTIANMKRGIKEKLKAEELVTKLTRLELDGKSASPEYKAIQKELSENLYYNMDRQGLAVTVMSNIMDSPIASKRLSDKMMKQAVRNMFGDTAGNKIASVVSNLYFSPQSKTGQTAMNIFGSIDAMGRYSLALEKINKGASLDEAVKKANSIYGDLDMIAPMWSQAIQHYGFIPFSNWYFRSAGGLAKSVLDNKVKAIGVAALLYGISEITDKRTDSMNPISTLVETPIDMLQMSPYFNIHNYARNATTPAVYKKGYKAIESGDPLSVVLTRDF